MRAKKVFFTFFSQDELVFFGKLKRANSRLVVVYYSNVWTACSWKEGEILGTYDENVWIEREGKKELISCQFWDEKLT